MPDEKETEPAQPNCPARITSLATFLLVLLPDGYQKPEQSVLLALRILVNGSHRLLSGSGFTRQKIRDGFTAIGDRKRFTRPHPSQYFRQLGLEFVRSYIFLGHQSHPLRCFYRSVCWSVILNQLSGFENFIRNSAKFYGCSPRLECPLPP